MRLRRKGGDGGVRDPAVDYLAGLCRMHLGDDAGAEQALESALAAAPDHIPALRTLTKLRPPREGEDRIGRLQGVLSRVGEGHEDAPLLL